MAEPRTQKADRRPISFVLSNDFTGGLRQVAPPIRPEDLVRNETSLQEVRQTFGAPFLDDYGPGLSTISISGHTGWRGAETEDGVAAFDNLRDMIWKSWHEDRKAAVAAGQAPDVVKLIFADALDGIVNVVAPGSFSLKRNKARPLLMMYSLNMTVLSERVDPALIDRLQLYGPGDPVAGAASVLDAVGRIENALASVRRWSEANLVAPVKSFLSLTTAVARTAIDRVNALRGAIRSTAQPFITLASDLAEVGRNIFRTFSAVAGLPDFVRHQFMEIGAALDGMFCVFKNVFRVEKEYPDYTGLYGASNCSSTIGGSPLSPLRDQNPWEAIMPGIQQPPAVTAEARTAILAIKASDPVLSPMSVSALAVGMTQIGEGVVFA